MSSVSPSASSRDVCAYQSVYRFVRRLEPRTPAAVVRVETAPGEEAQVDFGYAGLMHDPRSGTRRKAVRSS